MKIAPAEERGTIAKAMARVDASLAMAQKYGRVAINDYHKNNSKISSDKSFLIVSKLINANLK